MAQHNIIQEFEQNWKSGITIEDLLKKEYGNKKNVAIHLGISRGTLYRKMKKYS